MVVINIDNLATQDFKKGANIASGLPDNDNTSTPPMTGNNTNINSSTPPTTTNTPDVPNVPNLNQLPSIKSESITLYKAIPSVSQINKMTREELKTLKKFLISHCLKEAFESTDIENIKKFATDILKRWQKIPFEIDSFYPEFINDDLNSTYNTMLKYTLSDSTDNPIISNLNSTVKSSLDQTMKLITQSSDWISIILSKNLNEWNSLFSQNKFGSLTIGKFLSISALCASIVYIMTKLFKSGFNKESTLSECKNLFIKLYNRHSINFKEGIEDKLQEYINKEVPSNVITLNSLINNAYPLAMGLLYTIGYNGDEISQTLPSNILILTEISASVVILWREIIGKKFKGLCKGKAMISDNLLIRMKSDINGPTDVFNSLNDFKNETMPVDNLGGE